MGSICQVHDIAGCTEKKCTYTNHSECPTWHHGVLLDLTKELHLNKTKDWKLIPFGDIAGDMFWSPNPDLAKTVAAVLAVQHGYSVRVIPFNLLYIIGCDNKWQNMEDYSYKTVFIDATDIPKRVQNETVEYLYSTFASLMRSKKVSVVLYHACGGGRVRPPQIYQEVKPLKKED